MKNYLLQSATYFPKMLIRVYEVPALLYTQSFTGLHSKPDPALDKLIHNIDKFPTKFDVLWRSSKPLLASTLVPNRYSKCSVSLYLYSVGSTSKV